MCIVFAVLLAVKSSDSAMSINILGPRLNTSFELYSVFSTPYANIPFNGFEGAVYYFPNVSACSAFPPPTYPPLTTNFSLIIVENYSQCVLEKINFAKQAGYEALLTYVENDTNSTITDAVVATGFPVVVLPQYVAAVIIENGTVLSEDDPTMVSLFPDITLGIIIVVFAFFILLCTCCMSLLWACLCCKKISDEIRIRDEMRRFADERQNDPGRRELIESILRHLAELEHSVGLQVPLGKNQATELPTRLFKKGQERDETCSVCVDDFEDGMQVKVLPCHHIFHPVCIDRWLSDYSSICPMCKADVRRPTVASSNRNNNNMQAVVSNEESSDGESDQALMNSHDRNRRYGSVPLPGTQ